MSVIHRVASVSGMVIGGAGRARGWRIAQSVPRQLTLVLLEEHLRHSARRFSATTIFSQVGRRENHPESIHEIVRSVFFYFILKKMLFSQEKIIESKDDKKERERENWRIVNLQISVPEKKYRRKKTGASRRFLRGALWDYVLKYSTTRKSIWNFIPLSTIITNSARTRIVNIDSIRSSFLER